MKIYFLAFLLANMFFPQNILAGEVITATEVQNCFYADAKMNCLGGEFKNTYYRDGDKIVRTNVFNFRPCSKVT